MARSDGCQRQTQAWPAGLVVLSSILLFARPATAQADKDAPLFEPKVWGPAAAASVITAPNGPTAVACIRAGYFSGAWPPEQDQPVRVQRDPAIDRDMLRMVMDKISVVSDEYPAQAYLLAHARDVPVAALGKAANRDLTYVHIWEQPDKYRGQIIHLEGKLRKLVKFDADKALRNEGIKTYYEGWIYATDDATKNYPYCVLFTEVPAGVTTGAKLDFQVACDAYFFKIYRYQAANKEFHLAPMLVGRTLRLTRAPEVETIPNEPETPFDDLKRVLPYVVGGTVIAVIMIGILLFFFFRFSDNVMQEKLKMARSARFVDPSEQETTGNPPATQQPEPGPPAT